MKPIGSPVALRADPTVSCGISAYAAVQADSAAVALLRRNLASPGGNPLPANFLKHSDEQTVVGLAAVFRAIQDYGLAEQNFADWAVLAAPRFFGRATLASTLRRFAQEGAWGVSPHVIPHSSQHSLSGTISQALKIHGPNLGAGGGPSSPSEAALVIAAFLARETVPGLWAVISACDPEPILENLDPARNGYGQAAVQSYKAVALALSTGQFSSSPLRLRVCPANHPPSSDNTFARCSDLPPFTLEKFWLALAASPVESALWQLEHCGCVELQAPALNGRSRS